MRENQPASTEEPLNLNGRRCARAMAISETTKETTIKTRANLESISNQAPYNTGEDKHFASRTTNEEDLIHPQAGC